MNENNLKELKKKYKQDSIMIRTFSKFANNSSFQFPCFNDKNIAQLSQSVSHSIIMKDKIKAICELQNSMKSYAED